MAAAALSLLALMCKETAAVLLPGFSSTPPQAGAFTRSGPWSLAHRWPPGTWPERWSSEASTRDLEHGDFQLSADALTFRLELLGGFLQNTLWPADPRVFRAVHPSPDGSHAVALGVP